jgi:hypothetical protein
LADGLGYVLLHSTQTGLLINLEKIGRDCLVGRGRWTAVPGLILFFLLLAGVIPVGAASVVPLSGARSAQGHRDWVPLDRVPATNRLSLTFGFTPHHPEQIDRLLRELSDPGSTNYHRYLPKGEFVRRFGPTADEVARALSFAASNHFTVRPGATHSLVFSVNGAAADVERAFGVKLHRFHRADSTNEFFAPDVRPTLDASLPFRSVEGLDNVCPPRPLGHILPAGGARPLGGSSPFGTYLGADFQQAYVPGSPLTGAGQAIALFELDGYDPGDITNYAGYAGLTNLPLTNVLVDGVTNTPGAGNGEVCLDIEVALSLAPGLTNLLVYEGTNPDDVLQQIANDDAAAQVSSSWSWAQGPGSDTDTILEQMIAQGQSYFQASGDNEAYLPETLDDVSAAVTPMDSPYVTSVGGTALTTTGPGGARTDETVWNSQYSLGSGGGVSSFYPLPWWQAGVNMNSNGGSFFYRNIPDVAMVAQGIFVCYNSGSRGSAEGTSCAAPLWAAFTALANQQAAQLGQPPVGFLNPALYALARGPGYNSLWNDITNGNNFASTNATLYSAVPGYDLCTGWGSPGGTNLINALTQPDTLVVPTLGSYALTSAVGLNFPTTNWVTPLSNSGPSAVSLAAGVSVPWLVANGTNVLSSGAALNVTNSLAGIASLPPGGYAGAILVTNLTAGRADVAATFDLTVDPSIVQNGGFETGDFTGWTLVGDGLVGSMIYNAVIYLGYFPDIVHSGFYGAFMGEGGYAATLSQNLVTQPGTWYQLSFWLANPVAGTNQLFSVSWNGISLLSLTNPPAFDWTNFTQAVYAPGTNAALSFAVENDPNYFGLDEVSVTAVPPVRFQSVGASTNGAELGWFALPQVNYSVQSSTNLLSGSWLDLASVTATNSLGQFTDTNASSAVSQGYYRLVFHP